MYIFLLTIISIPDPREEFIKEIIIESEDIESPSSSFSNIILDKSTKDYKSYNDDFSNGSYIDTPGKCYVASVRDNFNARNIPGLNINMKYTKYIKGFSFCTDDATILQSVKNDPSTLYVEDDKIYKIAETQTSIPDHMLYMSSFGGYKFINFMLGNYIMRYLPFRMIYKFFYGYYKYKYTGKNLNIYLLDTTVNTTSDDISGRVFNLYKKSSCSQHGTNVATLIIGRKNGFAKDAIITALNVLDCEGKAPLSIIIAALENVKAKSLLCLPISGPKSEIFNTVVNSISDSVFVVTAAGNFSDNGCMYSPGSAEGVINVGSIDRYGNISSFSNFNSCLSIYSLGEDLLFNSMKRIKGTSYSAGLVASSIAIYLEYNPDAEKADIWKYLVDNSHRINNAYFVQNLPNLNTMNKIDVSDNELFSSDNDDGMNVYVVFIYAFMCTLVIGGLIYLTHKRKKNEDLTF